MENLWENLNESERRMVIAGAAVMVILIAYVLIWEPIADKVDTLEKTVARQRSDLVWMQSAAQQIRQMRVEERGRGGGGDRSLLSLVDQTARQYRLSAALKRVEPKGRAVRVRLEQAAFDDVIKWLGALQQKYSADVETLTVDREDLPGIVTVNITLARG